MAVKKLDLIRDHCLVGRPVVDVEMADAWIDAELTFRGLARGGLVIDVPVADEESGQVITAGYHVEHVADV